MFDRKKKKKSVRLLDRTGETRRLEGNDDDDDGKKITKSLSMRERMIAKQMKKFAAAAAAGKLPPGAFARPGVPGDGTATATVTETEMEMEPQTGGADRGRQSADAGPPLRCRRLGGRRRDLLRLREGGVVGDVGLRTRSGPRGESGIVCGAVGLR